MRQRVVLTSELVNHDFECLRRLLLNERLRNESTIHLGLRISTVYTLTRQLIVPSLQIEVIFTGWTELHAYSTLEGKVQFLALDQRGF
jgi:hypothetical protein